MKHQEFILENEDLRIVISSFGGTILSFEEKHLQRDIALGFKSVEEYDGNGEFFGAMVGRNANRIADGRFELNGREYEVETNDGPNNLHSGKETFAFQNFEVSEVKKDELTLTLHSPDGQSGFPGNLDLKINYKLVGNHFTIHFEGVSDEDTLMNITNHSYFNLDEINNSVLDHEMEITAEEFCLNDENGMATGNKEKVDGGSFDFRKFTKIADNFAKKHPNLMKGGIDHNFVYETTDRKKMVSLRNKDLVLSVYADTPDLQIYTSCFMVCTKGKQDYHQYAGVAIEPQYCPNAINMSGFIKPILKKGEVQSHTFEYVLERR